MTDTKNVTALSWWFPKIQAAGLPVPRTEIMEMPRAAQEEVFRFFDGDIAADATEFTAFAEDVRRTGSLFGVPFFLRTDHTSNKHSWQDACFVRHVSDVHLHIWCIIEFSEICDLMGLPWSTWAVREMLPTRPLGLCQSFGNMPVCREFRFFVDEGKVRCWHPYWPLEALEQGGCTTDCYGDLSVLSDSDAAKLCDMASASGRALGGSWSVDILDTRRGWFVTDMAEADKSFHWDGCPQATRQ